MQNTMLIGLKEDSVQQTIYIEMFNWIFNSTREAIFLRMRDIEVEHKEQIDELIKEIEDNFRKQR